MREAEIPIRRRPSFLESPFPISHRPLTPRGIVPLPSPPLLYPSSSLHFDSTLLRRPADGRQSRATTLLLPTKICIAPCTSLENTDVRMGLSCHRDVCITRAVFRFARSAADTGANFFTGGQFRLPKNYWLNTGPLRLRVGTGERRGKWLNVKGDIARLLELFIAFLSCDFSSRNDIFLSFFCVAFLRGRNGLTKRRNCEFMLITSIDILWRILLAFILNVSKNINKK